MKNVQKAVLASKPKAAVLPAGHFYVAGETLDSLRAKGIKMGNPAYNRKDGEDFKITFNGIWEERTFGDNEPAGYLLTKEGYSIKINAGFDAEKFAAGKTANVRCVVTDMLIDMNGPKDGPTRPVHYIIVVPEN